MLQVEYVPIQSIKPYERNARKHQDYDVDAIAASIQEFGFDDPIAIWKDEIVEGHGRLLAAKKLGMTEVPIIRLDHLTDEQRRAYALAHNKTAELSSWDFELQGLELADITDIDMSQFGFDAKGISDDTNGPGRQPKPEVEFTEVLGEENNYIVLKFESSVDWLQVETLFGLKPVKAYSTRNDGKIGEKMERVGVGRVVDGAEFLNRLGVGL